MSDTALDAFLAALSADDPERLYDRAPCGYLTTTPTGVIAKVNKTFLTMLGYDEDDLVGERRFVDLLTTGGRIYHETHFGPMLQMQGTAREIAFDLVSANGQRLPVLVNSVLERDDLDVPVAVHTAVFDASHRREYERELLRAKQRAEASEDRARLLSHTLQQSFIPPSHPQIPGLDLASAYQPAGEGVEIGGDFFDVFEVGPDDWCLVIGDVCGKGVEAALVTALARHTIRAAAVRQAQPSAMLHTLNEVLLHHETDRFCTLALARLRFTSTGWSVTVSCGGHPLPLLLHPDTSPVPVGQPGSLVGILPAPCFHDSEIELHPGEAIVAYTDGVTEARGIDGELFGEERLVASLARGLGSATALVNRLLDDVGRFQTGKPNDDLAVVVVARPQ